MQIIPVDTAVEADIAHCVQNISVSTGEERERVEHVSCGGKNKKRHSVTGSRTPASSVLLMKARYANRCTITDPC
jgi:hypothetical protein